MSERIVQQPPAQSAQEKFSDLPTAEIERSTFDMSHPWKGTMDTNRIVPCLLQEVLPGDTFNVQTTAFMRLATPLKPIMDGITADLHYFFVPNRIVWDSWVNFMGERNPDGDLEQWSVPQIVYDTEPDFIGSILDYMGVPYSTDTNGDPIDELRINALPWRGYYQIYNDWYRNENIEDSIPVEKTDAEQDIRELENLKPPQLRHKRSDYFTRALPWPQKGDPVFLPLGTEAIIRSDAFSPTIQGDGQMTMNVGGTSADGIGAKQGGDGSSVDFETHNDGSSWQPASWAYPALVADLTEATAVTINELRTAFQIQRLLERDARGGTRYIEILLSHFNVQSPDFRLQRAEFLGSGSARIIVNPVAATVATEDSPQGNLAAVGTGLVKGGFTHSFTEHGYLFGMVSCRADLTYQDGLDRHWSRSTRYDYYWPALSHLGEQAILNKEVKLTGLPAVDDEIWGYQERYAEYRYQPGRVTGLFRSEAPESLDVWHLAQDFSENVIAPPLDLLFIKDVPPIDRVVAVPSEPDLIVDMWHKVTATRPMPVYAVPGLVDHF